MLIGKRTQKVAVDLLERLRSSNDGVRIGQALLLPVRVVQLVDGGYLLLIPDLFEPASR
jgi:hypothetical protein